MSFAAIGIGLTAVSVGVGAASAAGAFAPSIPNAPNLASSSAEVSNANAQFLPIQRGLSSAAQTGGKYTFSLPAGIDGSQFGFNNIPNSINSVAQTQVFIPSPPDFASISRQTGVPVAQLQAMSQSQLQTVAGSAGVNISPGNWVNYNPADFQPGGQYASVGTPQLRNVQNNNGTYTVDFAGYGTGQTQATVAKQEAADQLSLSQKYDPQFIASALQQEQQADPDGTAARAEENTLIQKQIANNPDQPVADLLQSQLTDRVNAGKGLDAMDTDTLNQSIASSLTSRGGTPSTGVDYSSPLTQGAAGQQRLLNSEGQADQFLSSGTTPEDVTYRRSQQNMADLSALVNGQTPESEFKSLSGAQSGPTPIQNGSPLPTSSGGDLSAASSFATSSYGTGLKNAEQQANPWLSGVTTALNAATAASKFTPTTGG